MVSTDFSLAKAKVKVEAKKTKPVVKKAKVEPPKAKVLTKNEEEDDEENEDEEENDEEETENEEAKLLTSTEVIKLLTEGNERFVNEKSIHPNQSKKTIEETKNGQHPIAAMVTCSDSRVVPEIIFDCGLGKIFDVRVAGAVEGSNVDGSLEYAVLHLNVPIILIMGHTNCGVVSAVVAGEGKHPGNLKHLLKKVKQSKESKKSKDNKNEAIQKTMLESLDRTEEQIKKKSKAIKEAVAQGKVKFIKCYYDVTSGRVVFL
jgi:carbonic anhydrase